MATYRVVGLPHTVTHDLFSACAFTKHVSLFCKGMHSRGHNVYHYGNYGAKLKCTKHISVTSKSFVDKAIGDITKPQTHATMYADKHLSDVDNKTYHMALASALRQDCNPDDYIILSYGTYMEDIVTRIEDLADLPIFIVESTIGYLDSWRAPYKVFESESVRSWNRSQWNQNWRTWAQSAEEGDYPPNYAVHECTPQFTDDTINTFIDPEQFDYCAKKEDYFLYLGRLIPSKGLKMAVDTCEKIGAKLIVAGQGDFLDACGRDEVPDFVALVGHADIETRRKLMSKAKGGFVLTNYSEHGGNVIHEYGLSGTPVICTAWGSFTHSVLHNKTGYLVQDGAECEWAALNIEKIEPWRCRKWQMNYTIDKTMVKFERYFERIKNIYHNDNDPYCSYPVKDLDYREMIHPDDASYDMNLKPVETAKNLSIKGQNKKSETEKATEKQVSSDEA